MSSKVIKNKCQSTIVIGDVHGLTYWKKAVEENPDSRIVFVGDYLDPYEKIPNEQLINNLNEIIQLKKERSDDVILLLGNHDLHYFCLDILPGSSGRYNYEIEKEVEMIFNDNQDLFAYAFQDGNQLFTHAGVAHGWFMNEFKGDLAKNIADQLNNPLPEQKCALHQAGEARGGSWCSVGGIFWADISELGNPLQGFKQYVGHNRVDDIRVQTKNGGQITFCDCLYNEKYLKLDN